MFLRALSHARLRRQLSVLVSGLAVFAGSSVAGAAEPLPISLPEDHFPQLREVLVRAAQQAPSVHASNIEAARTDAYYISARASLLPSLTASGSYNWSESEIRDRPETACKNDGLYYSVSASQHIFHWGALKAQTDIANLERLIAEKQTSEVYRELAVSLRRQYLTLVLSKLALRNQRFVQQMAEDQLALQEERLRAGSISEGDILEPRLQAEEARYGTLSAELDFEAALRSFARLAGLTGFTVENVADAMPRPQFSADLLGEYMNELSSAALRDLPQTQIYELRDQQNQKSYHIARTRLLPKVSASASYGVSNLTTVTGDTVTQTPTTSTFLSINAYWPIFDGFAARGGRLAALATKRLNERQLDTFLETRMNDLRQLQGSIQTAAQLMDLTDRRNDLSREAVRLTRQNQQLGRASQSEVAGVMNNANSAELRAASARSNFLGTWSSYVSLSGQDPIMEEVSFAPASLRR